MVRGSRSSLCHHQVALAALKGNAEEIRRTKEILELLSNVVGGDTLRDTEQLIASIDTKSFAAAHAAGEAAAATAAGGAAAAAGAGGSGGGRSGAGFVFAKGAGPGDGTARYVLGCDVERRMLQRVADKLELLPSMKLSERDNADWEKAVRDGITGALEKRMKFCLASSAVRLDNTALAATTVDTVGPVRVLYSSLEGLMNRVNEVYAELFEQRNSSKQRNEAKKRATEKNASKAPEESSRRGGGESKVATSAAAPSLDAPAAGGDAGAPRVAAAPPPAAPAQVMPVQGAMMPGGYPAPRK